MGAAPELRTERLLLRRWQERDGAPAAAINADAEVARYFPAALTAAQSEEMIVGFEAHFERHGYGLWALELRDAAAPGAGELLGFTGLNVVSFRAPFTPAVEVGWRLRRSAWGEGYATEAARAALAFGFGEAGLTEIVAMTVPANRRSRAVMERLGMTRDADADFEHPRIASDSALRRHVLYRLSAGAWAAQGGAR